LGVLPHTLSGRRCLAPFHCLSLHTCHARALSSPCCDVIHLSAAAVCSQYGWWLSKCCSQTRQGCTIMASSFLGSFLCSLKLILTLLCTCQKSIPSC
jgi:hypothetical protein